MNRKKQFVTTSSTTFVITILQNDEKLKNCFFVKVLITLEYKNKRGINLLSFIPLAEREDFEPHP